MGKRREMRPWSIQNRPIRSLGRALREGERELQKKFKKILKNPFTNRKKYAMIGMRFESSPFCGLSVRIGALAQLGAHNTGSVGVRGSSPLCSTMDAAVALSAPRPLLWRHSSAG